MSSTIELPSLLSFERKLENSDGLMFSGNWDNIKQDVSWEPISIIPRFNRSTQSAHGISDENKIKPNPVSASNDDANLPLEHDTLKLSFSLRVIGNLGVPFACNVPDFEQAIVEKVNEFKQTDMLDELAKRYATNIANGRFLWRNRVGAEQVRIIVNVDGQDSVLEFNAYDYGLNDFNDSDEQLTILTNIIKQGLADEQGFCFMHIDAYVKLGAGQHVFPSQEMNMGEKRKSLFKIKDQAAMHNVKIGNALRTVDTWYEQDAKFPIAAEPYGAVTQRGQAYRPSGNDLYTLMINWVNDEISPEEQAYVVSNLIRGGVFSKVSKDSKE
ncbi:type I-F CRISPR-associated protein Csy3 [uncultured Moraxella sp.]|uniref:type I-F CRISPR-associated protein Csy3 n=1 Tax=uncultured Moraxella sp. TaxID=263769 RepID=UPI0025F40CFC|nr:type I-F CRISPR-associated protein Csy3 [uncultured Moraxella sp.]